MACGAHSFELGTLPLQSLQRTVSCVLKPRATWAWNRWDCFACSVDAMAQTVAEQEVENLSGLSTSPGKDIFVVRENGTTCLMAEFAAKFIVPYDVWANNYVDVRNLFPPWLALRAEGHPPLQALPRPQLPASSPQTPTGCSRMLHGGSSLQRLLLALPALKVTPLSAPLLEGCARKNLPACSWTPGARVHRSAQTCKLEFGSATLPDPRQGPTRWGGAGRVCSQLITEQAEIALTRGAEVNGRCGHNESELQVFWVDRAYTLKMLFVKVIRYVGGGNSEGWWSPRGWAR